MSLPTVKVRDPLNSDDYIIINESGYDPVSMTLWDERISPIRQEAILDAIRLVIEAGDESALTTTGFPKVPALEEILGFNITAEERDVAWVEYTDQ